MRPLVVAVASDSETSVHVRHAFGLAMDVACVRHSVDIERRVGGRIPAAVMFAVTGVGGESPVALAAAVRRIRARWKSAALMLYAPLTPDAVQQITSIAAEAGIPHLILRGYGDLAAAIQRRVEASRNEASFLPPMVPSFERLFTTLNKEAADVVRVVEEWYAEHPGRQLTVDLLAKQLHVSRRTLENRFHTWFPVTPERFIGWCRIVIGVLLLRQNPRRIAAIAKQLRFKDDSAFRIFVKRYTGLSLGALLRSDFLPIQPAHRLAA